MRDFGGAIACRDFNNGDVIVEYFGRLICNSDSKLGNAGYNDHDGSYMMWFYFCNEIYCIDATAEDGSLGRLINHSRRNSYINIITSTHNV